MTIKIRLVTKAQVTESSPPSKIAVFFLALVLAMKTAEGRAGVLDYRLEMKALVASVASRARAAVPNFGIFPQNAAALGDDPAYAALVTGISREDLHYGYDGDGLPTPPDVTAALETELDRFTAAGKIVLTLDYPFRRRAVPEFDAETIKRIRRSYRRSRAKGYIPYATVRSLSRLAVNPVTEIPPGPGLGWDRIKDWAIRLQPRRGQGRRSFLDEFRSSAFDLIVMDYSLDGTDFTRFSFRRIASLKAGGRKVLAYLSIGEAEDYRWYWRQEWDADGDGKPDPGAPGWLLAGNPYWPGNYKVAYWDPAWRQIVFDYLDIIVAQGFDGVYLDIVDAYEYFESSQEKHPMGGKSWSAR